MFTLTGQDRHGVALMEGEDKSNYRIRRLTPKECFRLQGFRMIYSKEARQV